MAFTMKFFIFAFVSCFSISAFASPNVNWPNAYTAPDGTVWSDILAGGYPGAYFNGYISEYSNCISTKDSQGNPNFYQVLGVDDGVTCEKDSTGVYLGTSSDLTTVTDSDAVEACKAIGGELPTSEDIKNLGSHYQDLPHPTAEFWSSTVGMSEVESKLWFLGVSGSSYPNSLNAVTLEDSSTEGLLTVNQEPRNGLMAVRCVSH
jgi:hypothetical protein